MWPTHVTSVTGVIAVSSDSKPLRGRAQCQTKDEISIVYIQTRINRHGDISVIPFILLLLLNCFDFWWHFASCVVCVCRRSVMLKVPSRLSRSTSPRWAKFTVLTERVCRGSRPEKLSPETSWRCPVSDVEVPHWGIERVNYFLKAICPPPGL